MIKNYLPVVASFKQTNFEVERERQLLNVVLCERRVTILERVREMEYNLAAVAALRVSHGQSGALITAKGTRLNDVVISDVMIAATRGVVAPRKEDLCPYPVADFDASWVPLIHEQLHEEGQLTIKEQQRIIRKRREDYEFDDDPTEAPVLMRGTGVNIKVVKGFTARNSSVSTSESSVMLPSTEPLVASVRPPPSVSTPLAPLSVPLEHHKKRRLRSVASRIRRAVGHKNGGNSNKRKNAEVRLPQSNTSTSCCSSESSNVSFTNEQGIMSPYNAEDENPMMGTENFHDGCNNNNKKSNNEHTKKRRMKRGVFGSLYNFRMKSNSGKASKCKHMDKNNSHQTALRAEAKVLYPQKENNSEHFEMNMHDILLNDMPKNSTKRWIFGGKKKKRELKNRPSQSIGSTPNSTPDSSMRSLLTSGKCSRGNAEENAGNDQHIIQEGEHPLVIGAGGVPIIGGDAKREPDFEQFRFYFNTKIGNMLGKNRRSGRSQKKGNQQDYNDQEQETEIAAQKVTFDNESVGRTKSSKRGGRNFFKRVMMNSFQQRSNKEQSTNEHSSRECSEQDSGLMSMSFATITTQDEVQSEKSFTVMSSESVVSDVCSEFTIWEEDEDQQEEPEEVTSSDKKKEGNITEPLMLINVPKTTFDSVVAC